MFGSATAFQGVKLVQREGERENLLVQVVVCLSRGFLDKRRSHSIIQCNLEPAFAALDLVSDRSCFEARYLRAPENNLACFRSSPIGHNSICCPSPFSPKAIGFSREGRDSQLPYQRASFAYFTFSCRPIVFSIHLHFHSNLHFPPLPQ